jgi:predicted metalloprotease
VIAHEVGHHVQTILGVEYKVQAVQARSDPRGVNQMSVRAELQADCLAGVWASLVRQRPGFRLSPEDIEELGGTPRP